MVRNCGHHLRTHYRSPHPRGDGPNTRKRSSARQRFSPPAWGWSEAKAMAEIASDVLPTRVGMVRIRDDEQRAQSGSPHPRGDGPLVLRTVRDQKSFSPPAWGWSAHLRRRAEVGRVLPTRVGMVRPFRQSCTTARGSPHPRGDGPLSLFPHKLCGPFSPPAWGWSEPRVCLTA